MNCLTYQRQPKVRMTTFRWDGESYTLRYRSHEYQYWCPIEECWVNASDAQDDSRLAPSFRLALSRAMDKFDF